MIRHLAKIEIQAPIAEVKFGSPDLAQQLIWAQIAEHVT